MKLVERRDDEFKIVYIQRTDRTERRPEDAYEAMKYFYIMNNKEGKRVVCDIYTNSIVKAPRREDLTFLNYYRLDRESYYNKLRTANVFVSFSIDEGFPLAIYEAIVNGSLGIIYKANWSVDMLGTDYPFFFRSQSESVAMIKNISENWAAEYEKFLKWREGFVLRYQGRTYFIDVLVDEVKSFWNKQKKNVKRNNLAIELANVYKKGEIVDLNKAEERVEIRRGIFGGFNDYRGGFNDYMHTRSNLLHIYQWKDRLKKGEFEV